MELRSWCEKETPLDGSEEMIIEAEILDRCSHIIAQNITDDLVRKGKE
jgi:hypothetical protein